MTYARQSFRNARRWAKNATLSDLEKSQKKQDIKQFQGLNIIGDKDWKDPKPKEGLAAGKKPSEFDPRQLKTGIKVESEHSNEKDVQQKIAMDHLTEDPKYYTHLNEMEEKYSKDIQKSADNTISKDDIPQVASVAVIDGDKILFGLRRDNKRWTLPGGHLNENEHPDTGALRELKEEANIVPKNIHKLGSKEIVCEDGIKRHIHAYVAFGSSKATNKNDPDKEMKKWEWVEMNSDKLLEILKNLHSPKNVTLNLIGI
jgi:ADP-ribose pyrophosphatase YjhB (NUDIX family)